MNRPSTIRHRLASSKSASNLRSRNDRLTVILVLFVGVCLGTFAVHAQDATWLPAPASGVWNAGANWTGDVTPTGTAIFGTSNTTTITFSGVASVGTLQFNAGAPAYSFNLSGAYRTFTISGTGIVNLSSNSPTFTNAIGAQFGLTFNGGSTADNATIINNRGNTAFENTSTAGTATITNNSGRTTFFIETSTAANATITNAGGQTMFFASSTAGSSTITSNSGGKTLFLGESTGGQARLIANTGGTVDLSHLTSTGMTAGSIEGAGTIFLGSAALTVGLNNLSTEVSGTIADGGSNGGSGGSLVKVGTGTLTLTGANTYSAATIFVSGILAVKSDTNLGTGPLRFEGGTLEALTAGGGITSSKAVTLGVGYFLSANGTFLADGGTTSTLNGVISGTGSLTKDGPGTLTLTGKNTFTGGTVLSAGALTVNGPQALGLGNVMLNGGILNADPQPINVKGNYTQNAGATLQLQVAGANPGQYDTLNVGGNAALGGTLQLVSLGFKPVAGNILTLVTTGGVVSNRFAQFENPFATGPGFTTVDLVYGRTFVSLEFLKLAPPIPPLPPVIVITDFSSFGFTPNQTAAGNLLDAVQLDPRATNLISFLNTEPFANLPNDLQKISPDGLTSFYEIGFSNANIQKLTLEGRLDDLHNGSNGFSSNMKVNGATVNDKAADGKSSKAVVEPVLQPGPENRWGVWVTGFGDFVNVDGDGNGQGYNFTTGGVSVGLDYRITDQLAIGLFGDYSHTWTSLNPSGHIDVDSGRGGVYATWFSHGFYVNGAIYGGHNNYDSGRDGLGGLANGSTEGSEWSTFIGGGYDFHLAQLTVGPIASLQYTEVGIDSFDEKGSLAPLDIHSGSAESLRSDAGFRAFYQWQIGKLVVEPSLKAAWEHEYKYSALPITASFAGIPGPSATFFGPSEGHDSAVVSAGVSVEVTPAITTYVDYDGQLGRGNYDSNAVTGGVRISF
jgi:outer membrane autotransporter protein